MKSLVCLLAATLLVSLVAFGQTTQPPDDFGTTTLTADLSPQNLVPPEDDRTESGSATVEITLVEGAPTGPNSAVVSVQVSLDNALAEDFTGFAIHQGGAGLNGPAVIQGQFDTVDPPTGSSLSGQVTTANSTQIDSLRAIAQSPAGYYFILTTSERPDGFLRGQLSGESDGGMEDLTTKVDRIEQQLDTIQLMVRRVGLVLGIAPEFLPMPEGQSTNGNGASDGDNDL